MKAAVFSVTDFLNKLILFTRFAKIVLVAKLSGAVTKLFTIGM